MIGRKNIIKMKKVGKVLVVDDNAGIRSALKILLPMRFEAVEILPSPAQLISTVNAFQPDVILLDMNFNTDINTGNEGLFWLSELRNNNPNQKVVLFTAYADISLAVEGMKRGAFDFIVKPWENEKLLATLERAVTENRKDSRQSNEYATGPTGMYWGTSQAMAEIKKTIEKIGPTDATVLITGENGTGKDLLAREIHNHSERRNGPMVSVDAGAIPETLFESELFGHVKGAFTDAYADKAGKVELAEGGTLFLDEIGNIPLHLQAKLLRVLQNRTITRVGDTKPRNVNIRLVCATNMDLRQKVQEGTFREDLFYRINTMSIHLPALRERPEDIVPLAEMFIKRFDEKYHREVDGIAPEAKDALKDCHWSGNIRELQNCIEKAVILAEGSDLTENELQLPSEALVEGSEPSVATLEEVEEKAIRAAVEKYSGNMSLVAKALNVSRPTLYSKLKKYGI